MAKTAMKKEGAPAAAPAAVPKVIKKKKAKAMKKQDQKAVKFNGGGGALDEKLAIVWKNHLNNAIMKKSGGTVPQKPVYTCKEDESRNYMCTMTLAGKSYTSDKPAPSKQAAEHAAAKACMEALYPEEFKFCSKGREIGGAKKHKAGEEKVPLSAKNKLCAGVQLIVLKNQKRSISKDDLKWATEEKDKMYTCKVTIASSIGKEGGKSFAGKACDSQKAAEEAAAEAAYAGMKTILAPLETAQEAKKKQKNKEKVEALKKKQAAKKAAK